MTTTCNSFLTSMYVLKSNVVKTKKIIKEHLFMQKKKRKKCLLAQMWLCCKKQMANNIARENFTMCCTTKYSKHPCSTVVEMVRRLLVSLCTHNVPTNKSSRAKTYFLNTRHIHLMNRKLFMTYHTGKRIFYFNDILSSIQSL